jgi:hypothetical protein
MLGDRIVAEADDAAVAKVASPKVIAPMGERKVFLGQPD